MRVAGADVFDRRWVVVTLADGELDDLGVHASLAEYLEAHPKVRHLGVDMPIDLASTRGPRACDVEARAMVGARSSSVFSPPILETLHIAKYARANEEAQRIGGAGISRQAFALREKIVEVRELRETFPRIHEVHPEVSFVAANKGRHLAWSKHTWNGAEERRRILKRHGLLPSGPDEGAATAGVDDVLDAAVVAWSTQRIAARKSGRLPTSGDGVGLIEF